MAGAKFGGWMDATVADILNRMYDGSLERDIGNTQLIDALTALGLELPASAAADLINEYAPETGKRTYNPLDVLQKKVAIDTKSPIFKGALPSATGGGVGAGAGGNGMEPLPLPDPFKEAGFEEAFKGYLASTGMAYNPILRRAAERLQPQLQRQALLQPEIYGQAGENINPFLKFLQSGQQMTGQTLLDRLNFATTLMGMSPGQVKETYGEGQVPVGLRQGLIESPQNQFEAFLTPLMQGVDPRVAAAYQSFYDPVFSQYQMTEPQTPFLQYAKRQNLGGYWQ